MARPNIILTGFMATGKTTAGKRLAEHLNYDFIDTDTLIVKKAGMAVADIFQTLGEPAFRQMESDLAKELSLREGLVISTGGGMLLNPANADVLSRTGQIFCLTATPEEIFERVSKDANARRPLLESPDPMQQVTQLLTLRQKAYNAFIQISTSARTPEQVVSALLDLIRREQA